MGEQMFCFTSFVLCDHKCIHRPVPGCFKKIFSYETNSTQGKKAIEAKVYLFVSSTFQLLHVV